MADEKEIKEQENQENGKENKRPYQKRFTQDELNEIVAEASRKAAQEAVEAYKASQPQTVLQVAKDEYVTIMYIGANASGTVVAMPKWGSITYAGGMIDVPKKEFMQGIGIPVNNALLRNRKIIVVDGLTKEEKVRFGVDYKEEELLSADMFFSLLNYSKDEICKIFDRLCEEHKRTVAKVYLTAYFEQHDNRVNPETAKALNELSKKVDKDGLFTPILEDYGKKFAD